jgi:prepilin-type N-terminal cleavage/methylation domain-containing protein
MVSPAPHRRFPQRGVTLIEMLIVMTLLSLMVGISFPVAAAGIDNIRLTSAAEQTASFLNQALTRADRRQEVIELTISPRDNLIQARSLDPRSLRRHEYSDGVSIARILPEYPQEIPGQPKRFLLYPGGAIPRIGIQLRNRRGGVRVISIDPVSGVPLIERSAPQS